MILEKQSVTVEEFDDFADLPENADKLFEFIGGEIVEVPSSSYSSKIASRINGILFMYLLNNDIGHLTGEQGGYKVSGERYAPDVAFLSYKKQKEIDPKGYNRQPPELAVEVVSPSDTDEKLRIKIANYQAAGTIVWVVDPKQKRVEVYEPGKPVKIVRGKGILQAEKLLPGFQLAVKDIFPKKQDK